jgi:NADPH:quinone reductase-like Zn-dependent oxidoreductase
LFFLPFSFTFFFFLHTVEEWLMKSLGLEDKVVLVTGGNRGIGAAIVSLLQELGTQVAYTYRSSSEGSAWGFGNPRRCD